MSDTFSVTDKVVVITGAGQGLGRAFAKTFASGGAKVVIAERNVDKARDVEREIAAGNGHAVVVETDVADEGSVDRLAATIDRSFGRADVLVNNAAIFSTLEMRPFDQIPLPEWERVLRVNVTGPFLCVLGSGDPWHKETQEYAAAEANRFAADWSKYLRGNLPIKPDYDVTSEDIAAKHLILFGDPASNSLIAQVLPGLPFQWTKEKITWDGKEYSSADHVPVLIYPSPLNPQRYVVLNSGHTFHEADYRKTNALLYPRLGDYAVLRLADKGGPLDTEVAVAGLFDDDWKIGTK